MLTRRGCRITPLRWDGRGDTDKEVKHLNKLNGGPLQCLTIREDSQGCALQLPACSVPIEECPAPDRCGADESEAVNIIVKRNVCGRAVESDLPRWERAAESDLPRWERDRGGARACVTPLKCGTPKHTQWG